MSGMDSEKASPSGPQVISIIDLGTNAARLDVVSVGARGGAPRLLRRERRMVRLGDRLFERGHLDAAAVRRTEHALREFAGIHRAMGGTRMAAVATSAMREAHEAPALVKLWKRRHGIAIRVISGAEEAALIAKGVLATERLPSGAFALIDIGGGSTELSLCRGARRPEVLESFSFDLGAIRVQQAYLKDIPPVKGGLQALKERSRRVFGALRGAHRWPEVKVLVGSGGTLRALRGLAKAAEQAKKGGFTAAFLEELVGDMQGRNHAGLLRIPGMEHKRADLLLAGAVLLKEAAAALGARRIQVAGSGLRDGLLAAEREALAAP